MSAGRASRADGRKRLAGNGAADGVPERGAAAAPPGMQRTAAIVAILRITALLLQQHQRCQRLSPQPSSGMALTRIDNSLLYRYWTGGMTVPLLLELNVPNG